MNAAGPDALDNMWLAYTAAGLGTHALGSTATDEQLAYDSAIEAGKTAAEAFRLAAAGGGAGALLWFALHYFSGSPSQPVVVNPPPPPPPPTPTETSPQPASPTLTYLDRITEDFIERSPGMISWTQAQNGARQCIVLTQYAIATGDLAGTDANNPCENRIVYLPGSDWPQATSHNWAAIVTHPTWIQLNYVSSTDRRLSGLSRTWYSSYAPCSNPPETDKSCDEYPYYSSAQSGPNSRGPGLPASLDRIAKRDNSGAGGRYGNFVTKCGLTSGGPTAGPDNPQGTKFLVIPMDFPLAPSTFEVCK
jgi:hypothetical protein